MRGKLTITDTMFSMKAALEGVGIAYAFEPLALPRIKPKRIKRVLIPYTFPDVCLYHPGRHDQPSKLEAFIEYARRVQG